MPVSRKQHRKRPCNAVAYLRPKLRTCRMVKHGSPNLPRSPDSSINTYQKPSSLLRPEYGVNPSSECTQIATKSIDVINFRDPPGQVTTMKQVGVIFPDGVTTGKRAMRRNMNRICGKQRLESFSIMFVAC